MENDTLERLSGFFQDVVAIQISALNNQKQTIANDKVSIHVKTTSILA
jgi:hypothetical protein